MSDFNFIVKTDVVQLDPDTAAQIRTKLESLAGKDRLSISAMNGLLNVIDQQVKDYNASWTFKGVCWVGMSTPSGPANNDAYLAIGSGTIFGIAGVTSGQFLVYNSAGGTWSKNSAGISLLYYTKTQLDGGQLDTRYYTETELINGILDTRYVRHTLQQDIEGNSKRIKSITPDPTASGDVATFLHLDRRTDKYDMELGNALFVRHKAGDLDVNCALPASPNQITIRAFYQMFKSIRLKGFDETKRHYIYSFTYNVATDCVVQIREGAAGLPTYVDAFNGPLTLESHTGGVAKYTGTSGTKTVTLEIYTGYLVDTKVYTPLSGGSTEPLFLCSKQCYIEALAANDVTFDNMAVRVQKQLHQYKCLELYSGTPTANDLIIVDAVDDFKMYNPSLDTYISVYRIFKNDITYQNKLYLQYRNPYNGDNWETLYSGNLTESEPSGIMTFEKSIDTVITGGGGLHFTAEFTITIDYSAITGTSVTGSTPPKLTLDKDQWPIDGRRLVDASVKTAKILDENVTLAKLASDAKNLCYRAMGLTEQKPGLGAEDVYIAKMIHTSKNYYIPYYPSSQTRVPALDVKRRKFVAFGWADWFQEDIDIMVPLLLKYGFTNTFYVQAKPLSTDSLGSSYTIETLKMLFNAGQFMGDHGFLHDAHVFSYPMFDGINRPTNDELRVARGDGTNAFGHLVGSTLNATIGSTFVISYLQQAASFGLKTWAGLTDDDCQVFRTYLSFYKCPDDYQNGQYILQTLDILSERYCGTTGQSVKDDYTTRTPNTASGNYPSVGDAMLYGIFQGCTTLNNHEVWERLQTIIKEYHHEVYCLPHNLNFWATPGGSDPGMLYFPVSGGSSTPRYFDRDHLKLANGFSKFTNSRTGKDRCLFDVFRATGLTTMMGAQIGYAISAWDHQTRREKSRMYKMNAWKSMNDYIGDGYTDSLRLYDTLIYDDTTLNGLMASVDVLRAKYDQRNTGGYTSCTAYTTNTNFGKLVDETMKLIAWGLVPQGVGDSGITDGVPDTRRRKRTCFALTIECYFQFLKMAGIQMISHDEAADMVFHQELPNGVNIFPNPNMDTTAKTLIGSIIAPDYPDGWSGGVVAEETIGTLSNVRCLSLTAAAKYYTRWYAIQHGKHNLSIQAKGTGTLKIWLIKNSHTLFDGNSGSGSFPYGSPIATITANNNSAFVEYTANWDVIDAKLVTNPTGTPEEKSWERYIEGMDDKICGLHIEAEITGTNFLKIGMPKLIVT